MGDVSDACCTEEMQFLVCFRLLIQVTFFEGNSIYKSCHSPKIDHFLIAVAVAIVLVRFCLYLCCLSEAHYPQEIIAKSEVSLRRDLCNCAKLCYCVFL